MSRHHRFDDSASSNDKDRPRSRLASSKIAQLFLLQTSSDSEDESVSGTQQIGGGSNKVDTAPDNSTVRHSIFATPQGEISASCWSQPNTSYRDLQAQERAKQHSGDESVSALRLDVSSLVKHKKVPHEDQTRPHTSRPSSSFSAKQRRSRQQQPLIFGSVPAHQRFVLFLYFSFDNLILHVLSCWDTIHHEASAMLG